MIQEQLFRRGVKYKVRTVQIPVGGTPRQLTSTTDSPLSGPLPVGEGEYKVRMILLVEGNVPVTLFENGSTRGVWFGPKEINAFLAACEAFLLKNRADVVVTYGGDPASIAVQRLAKRHGAKIVFWLHNFSYTDRAAFALVDYIVVPSEFSKRYYREKLGLDCRVLPNIVHWEEAKIDNRELGAGIRELQADGARSGPAGLKYVTFINPEKNKGVYVFARIAEELGAAAAGYSVPGNAGP